MNGTIFGIGPLEVLLVVILVLLVFGPERLPGLMRELGRNLRRFRKYYVAFASELKKEMAPFQDDFKEIKDTAAELSSDLAAIRDAADIRGIIAASDLEPARPEDAPVEQTIAPPVAETVTTAPIAPMPAPYTPRNGNGAGAELDDDNPWVQAVRAPRADRLDDDNPWGS